MNKKEVLLNTFKSMKSKVEDIEIINLCSVDGFPICCSTFNHTKPIDEEKLAAVTSSITALSVATSNQLIGSHFYASTIETDKGMMFLVRTKFLSKDCILSIITRDDNNIGKVRYFAIKLAKILKAVKLSTV